MTKLKKLRPKAPRIRKTIFINVDVAELLDRVATENGYGVGELIEILVAEDLEGGQANDGTAR